MVKTAVAPDGSIKTDPREEIEKLLASRKGYKSALTKVRNRTLTAIQAHDAANAPTALELRVTKWQEALQKYEDADHLIQSHSGYEAADDDKDFDEQGEAFIEASSTIIELRQAYDATQQPQAQPVQPPPAQNQGRNLPKLQVSLPPTLEEDLDLRVFTKWKPLWNNYSRLCELDQRDRETRVAAFWQCCSPGFLNIIHHTIGVTPTTHRDVPAILDLITTHLRDLRNQFVDMRDYLSIKQKDGQDYTSLCNEIREYGDYADIAYITEDRLNLGILLQSMSNESDRAKLMAEDPDDFDEARQFVLGLETARKGAKQMKESNQVGATSKYKQQKSSFKTEKLVKPGDKTDCKFCGSSHAKGECPAWNQVCLSCGRKGHFAKCCKGKQGKQNEKKKTANNVHTVQMNNMSVGHAKLSVKLLMGKKFAVNVQAIPDTGADISVIGEKIFAKMKWRGRLKPIGDREILSVNRKPLKLLGLFKATIKADGHVAKGVLIAVCKDVQDFFMDVDTCKKLNIISDDFPHPMSAKQRVSAVSKSIQENAKPMEVWPDRMKWIEKIPEHSDDPELLKKIEEKLFDVYADVFDASKTLRPMRGEIVGEPMKINLKENYKPFAIHTARQIPYALRDELKKELDDMVKKGVLEKVGDVATEWCHPIVVVPKPDGKIRLCVDLTKLNTEVQRTSYHTKTPQEAISSFNKNDKYFACLDMTKGYWQMPLHEESQHLTTFITCFGRYKYLRCPMGFVSTGDSFSYRGDIAIDGLPVAKVVDDMGMGKPTLKGLVDLVCQTLERCAKHGLTVSKQKSKLCAKSIKFVGYQISHNSIKADPKKLDAIAKFPVPENRTDLRSFMGLVNQLGRFSSQVSEAAGPLRELLKVKNEFKWYPDHTAAFEDVKRALVSPPVLGMFDKNARTCLQTDASRKNGLGYALLQQHEEDGPWRLIQCGSRFLTDAETRYAMVELEALAILWAIRKCTLYLTAMPHFDVVSDHNPLKSLFNKTDIAAIENPKVQDYRMKLMSYNFTVHWRKGSEHKIPDALSRAPVHDPEEEDEAEHIPMCAIVSQSAKNVCEDLMLTELRKKAVEDEDYQKLVKAVLSGLDKNERDCYVRQFKKMKDELSVDDGLVLRGCQIVIPPCAIKDVLKKLHSSHQGIEKTKRRARQSVYWPGYCNDIQTTVEACSKCQYYRPSHAPEPLLQEEVPTRPFEMATSDLFSYGGKDFLIYADRYSGFPMVYKYGKAPSSSDVMKSVRQLFSLTGVPNSFRSDGGPQYKAESFQDFLREWSVKWMPSSPHNPQSNGHAEVIVKLVKHLLAKCDGKVDSDEFAEGLLELRNSPREDGLSPAQRLFGHPLRSKVPAHWKSFDPKWQLQAEVADKQQVLTKTKQKFYHDRSVKIRGEIPTGSTVLVQDPISKRWDSMAQVVGTADRRRYHLRFPSGRILWRNKKFLRLASPDLFEGEEKDEDNDTKIDEPRRSLRVKKKPERLSYK